MRYLSLAPWRRAPGRALSILSLSAGVAVAAFVLGLAAGSRPMFVSSAASGSLHSDIEDGCRYFVGMTIESPAAFAPVDTSAQSRPIPQFADADAAIGRAVAGIDGLERVVTVFGPVARVAAASSSESYQMSLMSRTGFQDHIEILDRGDEPGVWLPDNISSLLGVHGGDTIELELDDQHTTLPVAGTYRDLVRHRDESWCSLGPQLQEQRTGGPPPPLMLMDQELLVSTYTGAGGAAAFTRWEFAPPASGWTLGQASRTVDQLQAVAAAAVNRATDLGATLGRAEATVDSASSIQHARRTKATVSSAAGPIALATAGVAMLVLLTAARSWLDRRRREVTVLALRGAGPVAIAAKAVLELLVPLLAGAAGGVVASILLVRAVGPSTSIESGAIRSGALQVAVAIGVAVAAAAVVVAAAVRRIAVDAAAAARGRLLWWEPPVLLLAFGALYELRQRGTSVVGTTDVDSLALLFPFLLLAGGSGLLARAGLSRRTLQPLAPRLPAAGWLAARRLAARRLRAIAVVTGAAVAVGIVAFAGTMSGSIRATATAKTLLGPGAEQVIRISSSDTVPPGITDGGRSTVVTRLSESGVVVRGHPSADVLGVDPATFADAAYWDGSFAGPSLGSLLGRVAAPPDGAALPAIAVGDGLPEVFVLTLPRDDGAGDVEVDVRVVGRADAFPGLGFRQDRPLVVVDRAALAGAGVTRPTEIWTSDRGDAVADRLAAAGVQVVFRVIAGDATAESGVRAQLWTVSYLELIGLAAALVTLAGLGLYFAASLSGHRLGSAVAQRLGMRRRTSAAATALEVGAMLVAGWLLGSAIAWVAARLVYTSFDPRPNSPPHALFRPGLVAVGATGLAAIAVALGVALVIERGAARRTLQGMLRDAE